MSAEIDVQVGLRIKSARKVAGLTQQQVADGVAALGWPVHHTAIVRAEQGERALRVSQLDLVARVLGVPLASLIPGTAVSADYQAGYRAGLAGAVEAIQAVLR